MRILIVAALLLNLAPRGGVAQEAPVPDGIPTAGEEASPAVQLAPLTVQLYPAPLQTQERLRRLIVELWCAERNGADDVALMKLYLKHSYPSLQSWHNVWNRALEDSAWVRDVYDEIRTVCPIPEDKIPPGSDPST